MEGEAQSQEESQSGENETAPPSGSSGDCGESKEAGGETVKTVSEQREDREGGPDSVNESEKQPNSLEEQQDSDSKDDGSRGEGSGELLASEDMAGGGEGEESECVGAR